MLTLLGLGVAGAAGIFGHMRARKFVGRRLRFTSIVEKPYLGVAVGVAATVVASPVVALIPLVGAGTAIAFGTGVGTGTAMGASDAKRPLLED
ncbi:MAG TPA: hypothetical protein EYQ64_05365 [Gemmatimonadetes bacterium]|nr:hypothetical protein [Gemmatimonadota bacterium]